MTEINKKRRQDVIGGLAYLESTSGAIDANYITEVEVMSYIRELEAELGFSVDREDDENYYHQQLEMYKEMDEYNK